MDRDPNVTGEEAIILWGIVAEGDADKQAGNLAEGDPVWVGVIFNDGASATDGLRPGVYTLECNNYGQMAQYRFTSREAALLWFDGVTVDLA